MHRPGAIPDQVRQLDSSDHPGTISARSSPLHPWRHRAFGLHYVQPLRFCEGNIITYGYRHDLKEGVQDLLKAREYLDRLIAQCKDGFMICNCTQGGTAACRSCPRWIEYFGDGHVQTTPPPRYRAFNLSRQPTQGWERPRCGKVHAPYVRSCMCEVSS